ncbi:oligopeptide/dipeptide ABC transporter ATP-binding protein [Paracoccus aerius]
MNLPRGCRFASRCRLAIDECRQVMPKLRECSSGQVVACHLV